MIKHIQIIILILTLPLLGFCQNKFSFGLNASTQFIMTSANNSKSLSLFEEKSGLGIGYSVGIQAQYTTNRKVFFRSGLNNQQIKIRHQSPDNVRWPYEITNPAPMPGNLFQKTDITITTLVFPLDFGYLIKSKNEKIHYVFGFGGLINMTLGTNTNVTIYENTREIVLHSVENEVSTSKYSLWIFGGFEKKISKKLILGIEPNIMFTQNKFNLYFADDEARTVLETGLTLRLRI